MDSQTNSLSFQLFIRSISGKTIAVHVEPSDTVGAVKGKAHAKHNEVLGSEYLTYAGKQLDDNRSLEDYSIGLGCTLERLPRLLGGCYFCHTCAFNLRAPPHTSINCQDPRNAHAKGSSAVGAAKENRGHRLHSQSPCKQATTNSEYGGHFASQHAVSHGSSPNCSHPKVHISFDHAGGSAFPSGDLPASSHQQLGASAPHSHKPSAVSSSSSSAAAGGYAAAAAATAWIEKVDRVTEHHHARNCAGIILVDRGHGDIFAFMVQEKTGHWGFVAGKIDHGETAFKALKREYREEVGGELPRLDARQPAAPGEPHKFIYHHSSGAITALYAGFVPEKHLPAPYHFRPNREIKAVRLVPLRQLHDMIHGRHATMTMRPCAVQSAAEVLRAMQLA